MRDALAKLEKTRTALKEKEKFLQQQISALEMEWTGVAAEQFIMNIKNDLESLKKLSTDVEHLEGKLNIVYRDCYKKCEENVSSKINHMKLSLK